MGSGKYSALAGAISREQAISNVANNLANITTNGYRKSTLSFESVLQGVQQREQAEGVNYNRVRTSYTDFTAGAIKQTDDPLDIALDGDGFLKVQGPDKILYTRRGDLAIDSEGLLTTSNGLPVLTEANATITVPDTDSKKIAFGNDGTIYTLLPGNERDEVAQIGIVAIDDKSQLKRESDTTFSLANPNLALADEETRVVQGHLELSNVNMANEVTDMIDNYRLFETYHKVLESYSSLGQQLEELGTLG